MLQPYYLVAELVETHTDTTQFVKDGLRLDSNYVWGCGQTVLLGSTPLKKISILESN